MNLWCHDCETFNIWRAPWHVLLIDPTLPKKYQRGWYFYINRLLLTYYMSVSVNFHWILTMQLDATDKQTDFLLEANRNRKQDSGLAHNNYDIISDKVVQTWMITPLHLWHVSFIKLLVLPDSWLCIHASRNLFWKL